jgi:hypothetical protein
MDLAMATSGRILEDAMSFGMAKGRKSRSVGRGRGAGWTLRAGLAVRADPGSSSSALRAPDEVLATSGPAPASAADGAAAGFLIASVSGQDTPRALLSSISSAVSRHSGYRSAMGDARSVLMIWFASRLRPSCDISIARLFKWL